jgi:hypothetical protein
VENEFCVTYIFEIVCVFVFVYLCVCVCVFAYSSRTEQPIYTKLGILVASDQRRFYKGQNPGKLSCVRVSARAVTVAERLRTIEEPRPDQSCLLRRGDYRNKYHNPEKSSWICVPVKIVSVARRPITIQEWRQDQSCLFQRGDYRNK